MRKRGIRVSWKGFETVEIVAKHLAQWRHVTVSLPANFHYVLCARLSPAARLDGILNVTGGAELLTQLATIPGLHDFFDLVPGVEAAEVSVCVQSPPAQVQLVVRKRHGANSDGSRCSVPVVAGGEKRRLAAR